MATQRIFYVEDEDSAQIAINKAWLAGGGTVMLPVGTTMLELDSEAGRFLTLRPGVSLAGYGPQSVLKVPDGAGEFVSIIGQENSDDLSGIILRDFALDYNSRQNVPDYEDGPAWIANGANDPRFAILVMRGKNITIDNVRFEDVLSINTVKTSSLVENLTIRNCQFNNALAPFDHDHSTIYLNGKNHRVQDNNFVGKGWGSRTAIELHDRGMLVSGNTETGYDAWGVIVTSSDTQVVHNRLSKPIAVGWGFTMTGLTIANNQIG
jgi:hypothetical protein